MEKQTAIISKEFKFEAAHRLPLHAGACANIHGHSYRVVVEIGGELNTDGPASGMVMDFGCLSDAMRTILDEGLPDVGPWDHSLMLWVGDPLVGVFNNAIANGDISEQRIIIMTNQPTAENMARWLSVLIQDQLSQDPRGNGVTVKKIEVWETAKCMAAWVA